MKFNEKVKLNHESDTLIGAIGIDDVNNETYPEKVVLTAIANVAITLEVAGLPPELEGSKPEDEEDVFAKGIIYVNDALKQIDADDRKASEVIEEVYNILPEEAKETLFTAEQKAN